MKFGIALCLLTLFSGCRYQNELDTLFSLEQDKIYLEQRMGSELNQEKQEVINRYFSSVKELVHRFNNDSRFARNFHRRFFGHFSNDLCSRLVISKKEWKKILNSCEVSGFFICAEEARHYQKLLRLIGSSLTDLEREALVKEEKCGDKLRDLGVINEAI